MLKKHMAACLVASAFMTIPVLAQTSTSPAGSAAGQPATSAPSGSAAQGASGASAAAGRFITTQQPNQWRASRLIGLDVYGADNERIGDINEVLVDRQGNADAVVVGVGGFLGMGEKNVALPFNAFEWVMEDTRRTAATGTRERSGDRTAATAPGAAGGGSPTAGDRPSTTASTVPGGTTASTAGGGTTATTGAGTGAAGSPATTATTAPSGAPRDTAATRDTSGARSAAERGYPDHAVLRMSKADLQNAPTFNYVGEQRSSDNQPGGAGRSGGAGTGAGGSTR